MKIDLTSPRLVAKPLRLETDGSRLIATRHGKIVFTATISKEDKKALARLLG
jgi:hypothetical protein